MMIIIPVRRDKDRRKVFFLWQVHGGQSHNYSCKTCMMLMLMCCVPFFFFFCCLMRAECC